MAAKNIKIVRPTLFNYVYTREELEHYTSRLWKMIEEDKMTVRIHEVYPLKDVARAHNVSLGMIFLRRDYLMDLIGSGRPKEYGQATHDAVI